MGFLANLEKKRKDEFATQNVGFVAFLRTKSHYINDIFAKQEGIVMLLVSFVAKLMH